MYIFFILLLPSVDKHKRNFYFYFLYYFTEYKLQKNIEKYDYDDDENLWKK